MQRMTVENLSLFGNNQNGNGMSLENDPKKILKSSLEVLQKSYKIAKKKDDLENMLAISDRLMLLYELLSNVKDSKKGNPLGFLRDMVEDEQ